MPKKPRTPYQAYLALSWTTPEDECEDGCGTTLSEETYDPTPWGNVCSACKKKAEDDGSFFVDDGGAHERRQMGISAL